MNNSIIKFIPKEKFNEIEIFKTENKILGKRYNLLLNFFAKI